MSGTCAQCGEPFERSPQGGRRRVYCSDRCRKLACVDVGSCVDCGKELRRAHGSKVGERCSDCNNDHRSEEFRGRERRAELVRLYLAGEPLDGIAERLGYASRASVACALNRLRHRYGYDLPYRQRPYQRAA